jgi:TolB-like protein
MKSKTRFFSMTLAGALLGAVIAACAYVPAPNSARPAASNSSPEADLDAAIRAASDYLNDQLPQGNKLVILNIQSEFPALSEYIIDELIANTVNDRVFSVVDRQQLNTIRAELEFQTSGEVSDESAQNIGQMLGAQIIISGAMSRIGELYRLRVRALNVQSAQIAGQFNRNISDNPTISALTQSQATGYGGASGGVAARPSAQPAQIPAVAQTPAPAPEPPLYKIGDEGPAGGLVFYDKGNNSGGWRYLEVAPANTEKISFWSAEQFPYEPIKDARAVGEGRSNTLFIMGAANERGGGFDWAAEICDSLEVNGYDDWFLPSRNEIHLMYGNLHRKGLGEFKSDNYWSSTTGQRRNYNSNSDGSFASTYPGDGYWYYFAAWYENFSDGEQTLTSWLKRDKYRVRAIRQF